MTKISIVVPVYNLSNCLEEFLKSLLNQTFQDFEIILVNDGSIDSSLSICEKYSIIDSRIKVIDKINEGAGPTRNVGIDHAHGDYIMFLDGDDIVDKRMLEILYSEITKENFDLVISNFFMLYQNGTKVEYIKSLKGYSIEGKENCRNMYIKLLQDGLINHTWNKLYKREIIVANKIKFPNLRRSQDAIFNCDYFNFINNYKLLETPLYHYRVNDITKEWEKFPENFYDIALTLNNHYRNTFNSWELFDESINQFLANYFINDVNMCLRFSFSPRWQYNIQQRREYCKYIISSSATQNALKYANGTNLYKRIVIFLMKNRNYNLLLFISYVSIFYKRILNYLQELFSNIFS